MGKTPTKSRKDIRPSAPYRRARDTDAPGAAVAKIQLVAAPAALPVLVPEPELRVPDPPARQSSPSIAIPALDLPMPLAAAPAMPDVGDFLSTLHTSLDFAAAALAALPHPDELVAGDPAAPEPPPGPAPAGDARSLRAVDQFALVYRHGAAVITRRGKLGERGTWRVVDYPSPALAAHAYALECSRLVGQGFRDVS